MDFIGYLEAEWINGLNPLTNSSHQLIKSHFQTYRRVKTKQWLTADSPTPLWLLTLLKMLNMWRIQGRREGAFEQIASSVSQQVFSKRGTFLPDFERNFRNASQLQRICFV